MMQVVISMLCRACSVIGLAINVWLGYDHSILILSRGCAMKEISETFAVFIALAPFALADTMMVVVQNYTSSVCQLTSAYASDNEPVSYYPLSPQGIPVFADIFPGQRTPFQLAGTGGEFVEFSYDCYGGAAPGSAAFKATIPRNEDAGYEAATVMQNHNIQVKTRTFKWGSQSNQSLWQVYFDIYDSTDPFHVMLNY